jgi:group II intron reverse transcriptase/maturase
MTPDAALNERPFPLDGEWIADTCDDPKHTLRAARSPLAISRKRNGHLNCRNVDHVRNVRSPKSREAQAKGFRGRSLRSSQRSGKPATGRRETDEPDAREEEVREMRNADTILGIHCKRGSNGLPLERVYRHLFNPEFYLRAYGKIYRNAGATTRGSTTETVDGMTIQKIHEIIDLLKAERYPWTPVRRTEIPKANGKMRPLGIPTWSDKLVQEAIRSLLEPYYEQRFSPHSHGFRPKRSCHSALREVRDYWKGTVWFIEGDIKGCFDNIDHEILLKIIRRDIHDGRLVALIDGALRAGYVEDWRYYDTTSGTPQGGIISPLLSNIYLNELDRFVEDTLSPMCTRGESRRANPEYTLVGRLLTQAREERDLNEIKRLKAERRKILRADPLDEDYRRLRYVRYADDFLLGFVGPAGEARAIRDRIGEFLSHKLRLTLSMEKTLITHAVDEKANFLGYEIKVIRDGNLISSDGRRARNGCITLRMPRKVVCKYRDRYSKGGKVIHSAELLAESDFTIASRYQSVLRGLYNYYCMAANVGKRLGRIKLILQTSLLKTLASKHRTSVRRIDKMYRVPNQEHVTFRVTVTRPDKEPLVATFGGMSLKKNPEGMGADGFDASKAWHRPAGDRSEVVQHLLYRVCLLCGTRGPVEMHHIRKMADINRPGRRPRERWERVMAARRRRMLPVCERCHDGIHAGRYDGPRL